MYPLYRLEADPEIQEFYSTRRKLLTGEAVPEIDWINMLVKTPPKWWEDLRPIVFREPFQDCALPMMKAERKLYAVIGFPNPVTGAWTIQTDNGKRGMQLEIPLKVLKEYPDAFGKQIFLDCQFCNMTWEIQREMKRDDEEKRSLQYQMERGPYNGKPVDLYTENQSKPAPKEPPKPFGMIELE